MNCGRFGFLLTSFVLVALLFGCSSGSVSSEEETSSQSSSEIAEAQDSSGNTESQASNAKEESMSASSSSEADSLKEESEESSVPKEEAAPYELTADNIKRARIGDRVFASGKANLYSAVGDVGIITSSGGQMKNASLRVRIPKSENDSYHVNCEVCDPGEFADVFYNHAAIDFKNSAVTVSGRISGFEKSEDGQYFWGVYLSDAVVEDVVFD